MAANIAYDGARIIGRPSSPTAALAATVERRGDEVAYRFRQDGHWVAITWNQVGQDVSRAAAGLVASGVAPGDAVLIMSGPAYEAIVADLAANACGAIVTLLAPSTSVDDLNHVFAQVKPRLVIAGGAREAARLRGSDAVATESVVAVTGGSGGQLTWSALMDQGAGSARPLSDLGAGLDPLDTATSLFAHGQDGARVLVPGRNTAWTYQGAAIVALGLVGEDDIILSWAPLTDLLTRALWMAQIVVGCTLAIETEVSSLGTTFGEISPTIFGANRAGFSTLRNSMLDHRIDGKPWTRSPMRVLDAAMQVHEATRTGTRPSAVLRRRSAPLERLTSFFGDGLRFCLADGGVSTDVSVLLDMMGVQVLGAMSSVLSAGLSSVDIPEQTRGWTVGRALPYSEVTTDDDGMLCVRGPSVYPEDIPGWGFARDHLPAAWQNTGQEGVAFEGGYVALTAPEEAEPESSLAQVDDDQDSAAPRRPAPGMSFLDAALAAQRRNQSAKPAAPVEVDAEDLALFQDAMASAEPEPVASEPVVSEPVVSEPVAAKPVVAEPVAVEPEPVAAEPVAAEPVVVEPEPVVPEPVAVEPEPVVAEPVEPEPEPEPVVLPENPDRVAVPGVLEAVVVSGPPVPAYAETADPLPDATANAMDSRFVRLCAPAARMFVTRRNDKVVALIGMDAAGLNRWATSFHVSGSTFADLTASDDCHGFVDACIQALNARIPATDRIQNFAILDIPLTDKFVDRAQVVREFSTLVDQLAMPGMRETESLHTDVSRAH